MQNILLLSSIYPAPDSQVGATPVVHYFAKEWKELGYNVKVVTFPSNFPTPLLYIARLFHKRLESLLNVSIRTYKLLETEYTLDGVDVLRLPVKKYKPHSRLSSSVISQSANKVILWCNKNNFKPDAIIGHWVNPQLEIISHLKKHFNVTTALVMHDAGNDFHSIYKNDWKDLLNNIDIMGYRSDAIKREFERNFGVKDKWFYCYSGIPKSFTPENKVEKKCNSVNKFVFVGMLIKRKYPVSLLKAIIKSDIEDYTITFIGEGDQSNIIQKIVGQDSALADKVILTNRIPRPEVQKHLKESDVFAMISKYETYGLVYLEAMATGCITIASRNEGFDGIIKDGINGFLCEAGNEEELTSIINRINKMSASERYTISQNAIETAYSMTDKQMAKQYIENISKYI